MASTNAAAAMADNNPDSKTLYLVDGSGYIFRAYHALPPLTAPDGTPVGAVYGYCNMLQKFLQTPEVEHLLVVFDAARKNFRNDIYPEYKAHRPPPPEDLIPQFPLIREATEAFCLPWVEQEGFEADDLIATYVKVCRQAGWKVVVVSSDKDLMQLMAEGVEMVDPIKNRTLDLADVEKKFGVTPDKVIEVQALMGDSTDNIPGVPGIGPKTAAELIGQYGDVETLLAHLDEIKQPKRRQTLQDNADNARISRQLVVLKDDVPVEENLATFLRPQLDMDKLGGFLQQMGFKTLLTRLQIQQGEDGDGGEATTPEADAIDHSRYTCIQEWAQLEALLTEIYRTGEVAMDAETTSLDGRSAELVGLSFCTDNGRAWYLPVGHRAAGEGATDLLQDSVAAAPVKQLPLDKVVEKLAPMLADPSILKIGHNIKYDMLVLRRYGLTLAAIDDTMLMSYVLGAGLRTHGLDDLARDYLGHTTIPFKEVVGTGRNQKCFSEVELDKACAYAAEDAEVTWRLHRIFKRQLTSEGLLAVYEYLERPLAPVIVGMEWEGIKVDPFFLKQLSEDFARRLDDLAVEIHKLAGRVFNIASPKQLGEILFQDLGLETGRKTKGGDYSTDSETLMGLAAQGHDLPARVLDWRQLAKLKSTYTDALLAQINAETGRVHTSFSMAVTSTGRLSSSDPNLQNIPIRTEEGRKLREAFVAEAGAKIVSLDYSQIELRLAAHVANIPAMQEAFHQGQDIHATTAAQVFGLKLDDVTSELRRRAKAINFGIIYGISPYGLAQSIGCEVGEAKAFMDTYFQRYPEISAYMEQTREFARQHGYVETLFGRRCHTPLIKDKNPARRQFAERAAINAPLQGTAADIIKRAMIRVPQTLQDAGLSARMLLQVHDELLFEVREEEVDATIPVLQTLMESAAGPKVALSVPLKVDTGVGDNWGAAH